MALPAYFLSRCLGFVTMYFDALTLAAVADELRTTILGGRIQHVLLPSQLSVALEIYAQGRRRYLILSAHPQYPRVHLSAGKPSRGLDRETPLLLLLRKYVIGGRITAIEQPELERVLLLSISKGSPLRNTDLGPDDRAESEHTDHQPHHPDIWDADAEHTSCELVVEAMERLGNIILVGDGNVILESARHVTPLMSRRPVQPREPYEPPPRQAKRDPRHATPAGLQALHEGAERDLARALVAAYRGVSPLAAREIVFRCLGQTTITITHDLPWAQLADTLRDLWIAPWQPCLAVDASMPTAFAPYLLTHLERIEPCSSISDALNRFYTAREQFTSHHQRRADLQRQLLDARKRLEQQCRQLNAELERAAGLEQLRWEGEMIFGFLHTIRPGQADLEIEGRRIALDPARSAVENAQARFQAYDKAKGAIVKTPELLRAAEARLAGLDETLTLLELADRFEQIEEIAREAVEQGYLRLSEARAKAPKGRKLPPLRVESSDGYTMYVGRSAGQNEQVTFKIGATDDLWLHARGIPGGHVIIKRGGRIVPERTILEAAALAAFFSKARNEAAVEVDIAPRSHVRRLPGGPPGLVICRVERTVRVVPRAP